MKSVKMAEVTRSGELENFHQGVAVLINSSGDVLKEWGGKEKLIYPRSALKPLQPLSATDFIPNFKDPDTNKIIDKLNLKITNSPF